MHESRSPEVIAEICQNLYKLRNCSLKITADEFRSITEERPDLLEFFDHALSDGVLAIASI